MYAQFMVMRDRFFPYIKQRGTSPPRRVAPVHKEHHLPCEPGLELSFLVIIKFV